MSEETAIDFIAEQDWRGAAADTLQPAVTDTFAAGGEADGVPTMLARRNGSIYALANTCSHLGGPLREGEMVGDSVRCPWHGSRFSLRDGSVLGGPATSPQPSFDVRINNGQIEVRLSEH